MKSKNSFLSKFFEDAIQAIADRNYQERVWVKGLGEECDSFDETINEFCFYMERINADYIKCGLNKEEYLLLKHLESSVDEYCNTLPEIGIDEEIIKDPKWHAVSKLAKDVVKEFSLKKIDKTRKKL